MHRVAREPAKALPEQDLFSAIPDPAYRLDGRGTVLEMNAAAELFERNVSLVGRPIQQARLKHAGPALSEALAQCISAQALVCIECSPEPGGPIAHHEVRMAPLPPGQVLVLIRDMTERKLTEDALRESDAKLRVLADHITDAFWIRSPDMRELRYVSPAFERIWGRPVGALYSAPQTWVDFIVPEDREHVVRTFAGLTADARTLDVEYRITRPNGELRWVRVRGFQVRDAADRLICNTGIVTDTTDRKLAQAELDAAHKRLIESSRRAGMAEIATNVLHNVGNILNSVTVSASLVRSTLHGSHARGLRQAIELMNEHTGDLGAFLEHSDKGRLLPGYLADIAQALRQEQQEMARELEHLTASIDHIREVVTTQQSYAGQAGGVGPVRIATLVEDALRMKAETLQRDRVTVVRQFDDEIPAANIDRARVLQVLVNLIANAREATRGGEPGSRRITIRVQAASPTHVRVEVQDEGEGIPPENLTRIFAYGFTTRKHGHGFGLHSCAQAAAEMNGSLTVHSDGPGRGATFTLELPIAGGQELP